MMAAVDERLKRRFSVSASMEEISKIPNQGSQVNKKIKFENKRLFVENLYLPFLMTISISKKKKKILVISN